MTAKRESPAQGHESIDTEDIVRGWTLEGESDEFVAAVLEDQKCETIDAVDDATRALLDDGAVLTDEKVDRLAEIGNALRALSSTLALRVPESERRKRRQ